MNFLKKKLEAAGSKIAKGARHAAQAAQRKVRSADQSSDPEAEECMRIYRAVKHQLKDLADGVEDLHQKFSLQLAAEQKIIDVVATMAPGPAGEGQYGSEVKDYIKNQTSLTSPKQMLLSKLESLLVTPLQSLVQNEIKLAKKAIEAFESAWAGKDVAAAKTKKASDVVQAQQEEKNAVQKYEAAKANMMSATSAVHNKKQVVLANLHKWLAAQAEAASAASQGGGAIKIPEFSQLQSSFAPATAAASDMYDGAAQAAGGAVAAMGAAVGYGAQEAPQEPAADEGGLAPGGGGGGGGDICIAAFDYDATGDDEITFKAGDRIVIQRRDESGWWSGNVEGSEQTGVFPANYLEGQ